MPQVGLLKSILNDYEGIGLKANLGWSELDTAFGIDLIPGKAMGTAMRYKDEKGASLHRADPLIICLPFSVIDRGRL
jgi:hypothetical protein